MFNKIAKKRTGIYKVGDEYFTNKLFAFIRASQLKTTVTWDFHNKIFAEAVEKYTPGKFSLDDLYKLRAQQLRDSFDYLILHYSGGADSWNILHTFLKNKIPLDHIVVKWPFKLIDKGLYTPNRYDKSAINFASEWDFTLKKDLAWLSTNHPEIKIEMVDWTDNLTETFISDNLLQNINLHRYYLTNILRQSGGSKIEQNLLDKGKKIASIFGIDKPSIVEKDNKCFMKFFDNPLLSIHKVTTDLQSVEYFYWTEDLPLLPIEQAYRLYQFYKKNPEHRYKILSYGSISNIEELTIDKLAARSESEYLISKKVIYPDWDNTKFQAEKPYPVSELDMSQKDIWFESAPFVKRYKDIWKHYAVSYKDIISDNLKILNTSHMKVLDSRWHLLGNF